MKRRGFTLIEMIIALAACAVIFAAVYGVFSRAIHLRNEATARGREALTRAHAAAVIRNDLRNGLVSGGKLGAQLLGSRESHGSTFPGYLKFTTTTARETSDLIAPDVQQIEYYVVTERAAPDRNGGMLVRSVDTNLLASTREEAVETPLLSNVEAIEVSFFDGTSWQENWEVTEDEKTLPEAVRVTIRQAPAENAQAPAPLEVLIPWTTQSFIAQAAATSTPATGARAGAPSGGGP